MRIFDRVASGSDVYDLDVPWSSTRLGALRKFVNTAPRVIADDPAEYLMLHEKDSWEPNRDFLDMRLPFPNVWVEWQTPKLHRIRGDLREWPLTRYATFFMQDTDGTHLGVTLVAQSEDQAILRMPVTCAFDSESFVRSRVIRDEVIPFRKMCGWEFDCELDSDSVDQVALNMFYETLPGLLSLSWMNCRTFELEDIEVPTGVRRKRERSGHFGGLDYKRIVIGAKHRRRWESRSGASANRFHLVRGHFKDHRPPNKPLFGKHVGIFWEPSKARGDRSIGVVNHEYHVTNEGQE